MNLFDASALLCFLQGEKGSDEVEARLIEGGACSAANWSEVAQKVRAHGKDWSLSRALLLSYSVEIEPVSVDDAELAATLWTLRSNLSLGDRLCMATGARLDATIWTADRNWPRSESIKQVR